MPFSNDEVIIEEEKSKLKSLVLIVATGLFAVSLFNICFCTNNSCRTSIEALLIGWLAMLTGGAGLSWLANPLVIASWILIVKNKKAAWVFGLLSAFTSLSFLKFHTIIENEAGHYNPITKVGLGYWFWLLSCLATFVGSLILRISTHRKH